MIHYDFFDYSALQRLKCATSNEQLSIKSHLMSINVAIVRSLDSLIEAMSSQRFAANHVISSDKIDERAESLWWDATDDEIQAINTLSSAGHLVASTPTLTHLCIDLDDARHCLGFRKAKQYAEIALQHEPIDAVNRLGFLMASAMLDQQIASSDGYKLSMDSIPTPRKMAPEIPSFVAHLCMRRLASPLVAKEIRCAWLVNRNCAHLQVVASGKGEDIDFWIAACVRNPRTVFIRHQEIDIDQQMILGSLLLYRSGSLLQRLVLNDPDKQHETFIHVQESTSAILDALSALPQENWRTTWSEKTKIAIDALGRTSEIRHNCKVTIPDSADVNNTFLFLNQWYAAMSDKFYPIEI